MNKLIKLFAVLSIIAVFGVGFFFADPVSAQTNEQIIQQLQAQIEQLRVQIAVLQQQLSSVTPRVSEPVPVPIPLPTPISPECPVFSRTLYRGVSDTNTGGEVTKLQKILAEDSVIYPEGLVTGYYGPLTEKAVQRWQVKHSVVSSGSGYGIVGPQTRARIAIACPIPAPKPIPMPIPTDNITVLSPNGGEQWAIASNQTIQWTSGPIAIGSSFAKIAYVDIDLLSWSASCKLQLQIYPSQPCPLAPSFSTALAKKVSNTGSFSWIVGKNISGSAIPTGPYVIRISNSENSSQYDQSDYSFNIVKEQSANLPPAISGVSGPSFLNVGENGKWEVKASDPEQGPLTYSVVWGDETVGIDIAERAILSAPNAVTQTAAFTHVYSEEGAYSPTFTVTDNGGLSAETSIGVNSKGGGKTKNNPPVINGIPEIPSDIRAGQFVSFSWAATDADNDNLHWSISWGDGTGVDGACPSPNPRNKEGWTFKTSHAWQKFGTYTVKAIVNDCKGGNDEYAFNVTVVGLPVRVDAIFYPDVKTQLLAGDLLTMPAVRQTSSTPMTVDHWKFQQAITALNNVDKNEIGVKKGIVLSAVDDVKNLIGAIPSDVDWITYNMEPGMTPSMDFVDPVASVKQFANIVRSSGRKMGFAPLRSFIDNNQGTQQLSDIINSVDMIAYQGQLLLPSIGEDAFVQTVQGKYSYVKSVNPNVEFYLQLWLGRQTPQEIISAFNRLTNSMDNAGIGTHDINKTSQVQEVLLGLAWRQSTTVFPLQEYGFTTHLTTGRYGVYENLDINTFKNNTDELTGRGLKWIRFNLNSWEVAPGGDTNTISWNEQNLAVYKEAIDYAKSKGLSVYLVTDVPFFAKDYSVDDYKKVAQIYYSKLASIFTGKIGMWQIFNEADTHTYNEYKPIDDTIPLDANYLSTLKDIVTTIGQTIRSSDRRVLITMNVSGYPISAKERTYDRWVQFYDVLGSRLDWLALDMYPDNDPNVQQLLIQRVNDISSKYGKKVVVAEVGMCTANFSEADQAIYVPEYVQALKKSEARLVILYEYQDEGAGGNCEETFGVKRVDSSYKPAYEPILQSLLQ